MVGQRRPRRSWGILRPRAVYWGEWAEVWIFPILPAIRPHGPIGNGSGPNGGIQGEALKVEASKPDKVG